MRILLFSLCFVGILYPAVQNNEERIPFSFEKRNLVDIIDFLASKKNVNIILPQPAADAETIRKQTITFQPHGTTTVPLYEAWNLLTMFLELSGFSLVPKRPRLYAIVRTGKQDEPGISRETLPLYVNTPSYELPRSEQRIRYIYYMQNIKIPTAETRENHPLTKIFRDMLSPGAPVLFEPKSNGFIIVDRADIVASLANLIAHLDATGFRETIEILPLAAVPVQDVVRVFDALKKAAGESQEAPLPFIRHETRQDISRFAADTVIASDERTNSLILMGRRNNVDRISEFVHEHMDVSQESGKSILHVYDLQYLDAQAFAPLLQNLVSYQVGETQATQAPTTGPERFFRGVQVVAESIIEVKPEFRTEEVTIETKTADEQRGIEGTIRTGGNRLIIAALQDDWLFIKNMIEKLDKPQPQVILEVLIADFSYTRTDRIRSTVRSKTDSTLTQEGVQFLASHITPVNAVLGTTPMQLAQDLLAVVGPTGLPARADRGSILFSFNDPQTPGIFGLIELFKRLLKTKVTSHPYLLTSNNQKGIVETQEIRRFRGDLITSTEGTFTIPIEDVTAALNVEITPHIAYTDRVRLDIKFTDIQFINRAQLTRLTRELRTTATLSSGQILAMGGIIRDDIVDTVTATPLLSRIPLIGQLFRGNSAQNTQVAIVLFVSPTIIQPAFNKAATTFTQGKIARVNQDISDTMIDNLKDPITHIFFKRQPTDSIVHQFLNKSANLSSDTLSKQLLKPKPSVTLSEPELPKFDKLKELLACEDSTFLRVKQTQSKRVLNS